jgi:electron transfer flavoprotein beta subunit
VTVRRELEGGIKAVVRFRLPGLVTCQLGLNTPRYPTLPNIMKARQKELVSLNVDELSNEDPRSRTEKMYLPEKKSTGLILEGDIDQMADQLIVILKEKTSVLR